MTNGDERTRIAVRAQLEAPEPSMDLHTILSIIRERQWLVLGFFCVAFAFGVAYVEIVPPVYQARALLQVEQQTGGRAGSRLNALSIVLPGLMQSQSSAKAQIQIMTSRSVLIPVIREFHLDVEVRGAPASAIAIEQFKIPDGWIGEPVRLLAGPAGRYTLYAPSGQVALMGRVGQPASGLHGAVRIALRHLALPVGQHLTLVRKRALAVFYGLKSRFHPVERGQGTGIVSLALVGGNPLRVADILNGLVAQYRREDRRAFLAEVRRSLLFVDSRLPKLKRELNQAGSRFAAFQAQHDTVSLSGQTKALLSELTALENQLGQLQLAEASYAERYTRHFPIRATLAVEEQTIRAHIAALRAQLERLPVKAQGFVRLREDTMVYAKLYMNLLGTEQDLKIRAASAVGNVRIVDPAVPPLGPIAPRKGVDLFIAAVLGLVLGLFAAFLRHSLKQSLCEPKVLEESFGLPLFAVIPHSTRQSEDERRTREDHSRPYMLLAEADPDGLTMEAIRSLRTSVQYALTDATHRVLVIAGPTPAVGKSFLSANLAQICADAGQRVVLIDADLRKGRLHRYFNRSRAPGLAELLSGKYTWQQAVHHGAVDVLASGGMTERPAELLMKPELPGLLKQLAATYDLVIVDVPPILAVTDALIVARHADLILLVLRSDNNSLEEVRTTLRRCEQGGVRVSGFIFNDLKRRTARDGYHYHYHYARERDT